MIKSIRLILFLILSAVCISCATSTVEAPVQICAPDAINAPTAAIRTKTLFIIAMPEEADFIIKHYDLKKLGENIYAANGITCVVTGIGGVKVNTTLDKMAIDYGVSIINAGYCGSNVLKKGSVHEVSSVAKEEKPAEQKFVSKNGVPCYSADAFVEATTIKTPCVFDMEFAYIKARFPNAIAYKLVSDNLSHAEFEKFDATNSWKTLFEKIDPIVLGK